MITFDNGRFEAQRDRYQWILIEHYTGTSKKTGAPKAQTKTTFHNNLRNMCTYIVDRCAGNCTTAAEIVSLLQNSERLLDKVASHAPLP